MFASITQRTIPGLLVGLFACALLYLGATTSEDGPAELVWTFDAQKLSGQTLPDEAGRLAAKVVGNPRFVAKPAPAVELPGDVGVRVIIDEKAKGTANYLPRQALTVSVWVRVDRGVRWGGIVGMFQDNGPSEKGWVLGYNEKTFYFGLASEGADDGDGNLTYLSGKTAFEPGRWYHVAASYDGQTMRLFVNGKLDGSSAAQSGPILYPPTAPFVIGAYQDDDELHPLTGAIHQVRLLGRALPEAELVKAAQTKPELTQAEQAKPGLQFTIKPYLQFGTRTSMTVMWETATPTTGSVLYGTLQPLKQIASSEQPQQLHEVRLDNLTPETDYFYRVVASDADGRKVESPILTFRTAVEPDSPLMFALIGDTQRNPLITEKICKLIFDRRPNFVLHLGDVVDNGPVYKEWTDDLFGPGNVLFSRVPVYPTIGNHERNHANYYKYFSLPAPEYYYQFSYGNADFFTVDSNKRITPDSEQYQWLEAALAKSKAKWKFVYHHHPPYSSDEDDYGDAWTGKSPRRFGDLNVRKFVTLYEKYGVDMVFNGHVHSYERTWPIREGRVDRKSGVIYITSGGGGGRLERAGPTPSHFKAEVRTDYHFCTVSINGDHLNFKAVDQNGVLFDYFDLQK